MARRVNRRLERQERKNEAVFSVVSTVWLAWNACGAYLEFRKRRNLSHVSNRILVGGMRGKTTFVRLLHAGLLRHGVRTLGRVSGDSPVLLLPDGQERLSPRRGLPNIAELQRVLLDPMTRNAEAVILENMAIRPDLQQVVREQIFRPTLQVMAGDAPDHLDVFPEDPRARAAMLLGTLDKRVPLLLVPGGENEEMLALARKRGFSLVEPVEGLALPGLHAHMRHIVAAVMAALVRFGAGRDAALEAIVPLAEEYQKIDVYTTTEGFRLADLLSVNDPLSTSQLLRLLLAKAGVEPEQAGVIYCHRGDRGVRFQSFLDILRRHPAVVVGDRPPLWLLRKSGAHYSKRLEPDMFPGSGFAFAAGNTANAGVRVRSLFRSLGEHARW